MTIQTITAGAVITGTILSNATIQVTRTYTIDAGADVAGTTFQRLNAQAFVVQVKSVIVTSSAVIIIGEPNVKLFMVV